MISQTHLHPIMVHFPIALITVGFLFDLIAMVYKKEPCLSKAGFWLEILGMAGVVVAFGTGYFFTSEMEGEAGIIREKHELFATITLISIVVATFFRIIANYLNKKNIAISWLSLGLYFISMVMVSVTGYLGGSLVIDFMIGL